MAKDASNDINYFLLIDETNRNDLSAIRHWSNLKVAFDGKAIWVKDFEYVQINSIEVKSIPYKTAFYSKGGKLYLQGSLLPDRTVPSVLWTPIERAFPIKLPSFNHNYFGIHERITMKLVSSESEREACAMLTTLKELERYIQKAPAVRLQKLSWVRLNNDKVFIFGKPLLPIAGDAYWQHDEFILPTGFNFELHSLMDVLNELVNPHKDSFVIWNSDNTYALIEKKKLQPLSIGSFRLSKDNHPVN